MRNIYLRLFIAVSTAILNWFAFKWMAVQFGWDNPEFIATVLIGSIALHEIGHAISFKRHGVQTFMFFAVILGGVAPLDHKKADALPDAAKMEVALAGMAGNIAACLIALALATVNLLSWELMLRVLNINALLMLWNLLPFWNFDGGRAMKLLFDSVPEHRDQAFVTGITASVFVCGAIAIVIGSLDLVPLLLLIFGVQRRAGKDDPEGSTKPTAMNSQQQCFWARVYAATAGIAVLGIAVTPHWV